MSAKKLERMIEMVINEDEDKARAMFHDFVVEKSREIYESIINEDQSMGLLDEIEDETGMNDMMEDEDFEADEEIDGDYDVDGDDFDDEDGDEEEFDAEVEFDDEDGEDEDFEEEGEEGLEDRVVDLEDKLDQLMADFEAQMGGEEEDMDDAEDDMDDAELDMDDAEDDMEDAEDDEDGLMEAVKLQKVKGLYDSKIGGDDGEQTRSTVAFNSGKKGMQGKPVNYDAGPEESQANAPVKAKSYVTKGQGKLIGDVANTPGKDAGKSAFKDKAPQQYGDSKGKAAREIGTGGSVKQDKRSSVPSKGTTQMATESKRTAKKRI